MEQMSTEYNVKGMLQEEERIHFEGLGSNIQDRLECASMGLDQCLKLAESSGDDSRIWQIEDRSTVLGRVCKAGDGG